MRKNKVNGCYLNSEIRVWGSNCFVWALRMKVRIGFGTIFALKSYYGIGLKIYISLWPKRFITIFVGVVRKLLVYEHNIQRSNFRIM